MIKESKLSGLLPIHYVEIANPKMLKMWLSDFTARNIWETIVSDIDADTFNDKKRPPEEDFKLLLNLHKTPNNYKNIDPLLLGTAIKEYVDLVIEQWKHDSDDGAAKQLVASLPLFVEMSKYLPHVNPSEEYTMAYRGTEMSPSAIRQFVQMYRDPSDWKTVKLGGKTFYTYIGSKKRNFIYKPHRIAQSWSVSQGAAASFGSEIVATPIDTSFFFDPAFMGQYGYEHEKETVHFGKEPMKVALLIDEEDYNDARGNSPWASYMDDEEDVRENIMAENLQVSDEEGTLTIPF